MDFYIATWHQLIFLQHNFKFPTLMRMNAFHKFRAQLMYKSSYYSW